VKKYCFAFEDPENGMRVPIIICTLANSFDDACKEARDQLLMADSVAENGYSGLEYKEARTDLNIKTNSSKGLKA